MELVVKSRNAKINDRQRTHIEEKLGRLSRYMDRLGKATVEITEEQRRNEGLMHRVQVTLTGENGVLLRCEQRAADVIAAVDNAHDALQRQIQRHKDKHWRRGKLRRQGSDIIAVPTENDSNLPGDSTDESGPRIVRMKEFPLKPMYSEEAVEQMELLQHDFFVFRDAESERINVLYRRDDGNYGLIVPSGAS